MSNIQAGRYIGRAAGVPQMGESKNGSPQIGVMIELLDEEERVFDTVNFYGSLTGGATPITLRMLRDLGWTGDSLEDWTGLGTVKADVDIAYETWEGKDRMKVQIRAAGVRMANPMDDRRRAALNAQLKGAILLSKPAGGSPTASKVAPAWASSHPAPADGTPPAGEYQRGGGSDWDGQGAPPADADAPPF